MGSLTVVIRYCSTPLLYRVVRMWYEYEPLGAYGCTRSKPSANITDVHPYSPGASKYNSGMRFYPSYRHYIDGMCEGDFFYLGYKPMPEPPIMYKTSLASLPFYVHMRWQK